MSNLLSGLLNLLSAGTSSPTGAAATRNTRTGTGADFEQILQQAQQESRGEVTSGLPVQSQVGPPVEQTADETQQTSTTTKTAAVLTESTVVRESFHLSIAASSLQEGMEQVALLLGQLSRMDVEQGAALVASLSAGKVDTNEAKEFVKTLKDILSGASAQGVNPLASPSLPSQWLVGLQQNPAAVETLSQGLPSTGTSSISDVSNGDAGLSTTWAGFSVAAFSYSRSQTDFLQAATGVTGSGSTVPQVQLPSDWKVSFGNTPLAEAAQTNLQSLVNLLVQSNAGKVMLAQAVAYEFTLKVSEQALTADATAGVASTETSPVKELLAASNSSQEGAAVSNKTSIAAAVQELQTALTSLQSTVVPSTGEKLNFQSQSSALTETTPSSLPARDGLLKSTVISSLTQPATSTVAQEASVPSENGSLQVSSTLGLPGQRFDAETTAATPVVQASGNPTVAPAPAETVAQAQPNLAAVTAPIFVENGSQQSATRVQESGVAQVPNATGVLQAAAVAPAQATLSEKGTQTERESLSATTTMAPVVEGKESSQTTRPETAEPKISALETTSKTGNSTPSDQGAGSGGTSKDVIGVTSGTQSQIDVSANEFNRQAVGVAPRQEKNVFSLISGAEKEPELKVISKDGPAIQGNAYLVAASTGQETLLASSQTSSANAPQANTIVQQVVQQVVLENVTARSVSHLSFQLVPENLGKVTVQVALVDQVVTAKIFVTHAEVREVLQNHLVELKTSLYQAGLQIDQLQVQVQGGGAGLLAQYFQYQQEGYGNGSGSFRVADPPKNTDLPAVSSAYAINTNAVNLLV